MTNNISDQNISDKFKEDNYKTLQSSAVNEMKELKKEDSYKRAESSALNEILGKELKILDHGFIRVVDYMGADESIVQAARVSYGKGTKKINEDKNLINYLMRHSHTTPFEMCEIKFHIKLPIFIARQWIRHRTANVNEYSARYSILGKDYYVPELKNLAQQSKTNKQGRENAHIEETYGRKILEQIKNISENSYSIYQDLLNEDSSGNILDPNKQNLSRELSRTILTLNYYTEMYWKMDLHNLLHFLKLRSDDHAQYEIREYANKMLEIVKMWTPMAYDAFMQYKKNSFNLSEKMIKVLKSKLNGDDIKQENSGLSVREWQELSSIFDKL